MNKITLVCENCRGTLEVNEGQTILFCPYCGQKTLVPESDEVRIARINADLEKTKIESENRYKNKKRITIAVISLIACIFLFFITIKIMESEMSFLFFEFLIIFLIFGGIIAKDTIIELRKTPEERLAEKRIQAEQERLAREERMRRKQPIPDGAPSPINSEDADDYKWKELKKKFENAGFSNVSVVGNNQSLMLSLLGIEIDKNVDYVMINGVSDFERGDYFLKSSNVTIHCEYD